MLTRQECERCNQYLDRVGWSLALVLTGSILLWQAPIGLWLIGVAVILLGMNVLRLFRHIPMSDLTLVIGIMALVLGSGFDRGVNLLLIPRLLIVIGLVNLFKVLSRRQLIN